MTEAGDVADTVMSYLDNELNNRSLSVAPDNTRCVTGSTWDWQAHVFTVRLDNGELVRLTIDVNPV
jgi:hypothetical protein